MHKNYENLVNPLRSKAISNRISLCPHYHLCESSLPRSIKSELGTKRLPTCLGPWVQTYPLLLHQSVTKIYIT
jgi:hypothetical protein